jgi:phosphate transport system ATP-binding protein
VDLACPGGRITALVGPTGCGKSTVLRLVNRLDEGLRGFRHEGRVWLDDLDVDSVDAVRLRRRVGMVFKDPAPFPRSVLDNVGFGLWAAGVGARERARRVEDVLRRCGLWDEVGWALDSLATRLSPGQQQRLCFARALAVEPDVLLLDDPTSAVDPVAAAQIEELILAERDRSTVILVTNDVQQAGRLADVTAFMDRGTVVESGPTEDLFTRPRQPATEAWLSRRF